jgi:MOSC domain-containing protein YiiM
MDMIANIVGLSVSAQGGVPKSPVEKLTILTNGCIGDKQNDLKHHGGPERAVCIFQENIIEQLRSDGHPI